MKNISKVSLILIVVFSLIFGVNGLAKGDSYSQNTSDIIYTGKYGQSRCYGKY